MTYRQQARAANTRNATRQRGRSVTPCSPRLRVGFLFLMLVSAHGATTRAADRIVLRDLTIISDRTVQAMSMDGVQLDNGQVIGWGEIETGRLGGGRQELFDKYVKNVGVHLFRIRQRLENGDYRSLTPSAEAIERFYRGRNSAAGYMVMQALMWGRMAEGKRAAAVAPYLHCYAYLRGAGAEAVPPPGERRLQYDAATGMCEELPPIWFDTDQAKTALPEVAAAISKIQEPRPPATRIYYGSLAIAAGDMAAADRALKGLAANNPRISQLQLILNAQREIIAGSPAVNTDRLADSATLLPSNRPLAKYWLGMAKVADDDVVQQREGVLDLLHLPAVYGDLSPALAAAGLYQAMQTLQALGDLRGSIALRGELLSKYGQTYHAEQLTKTE